MPEPPSNLGIVWWREGSRHVPKLADPFRTSAASACCPERLSLEKEFWLALKAADLISPPNYRIYLKLMIDGVVSRPFSAGSIAPSPVA